MIYPQKDFSFNTIFQADSNQEQIFNNVGKPVVEVCHTNILIYIHIYIYIHTYSQFLKDITERFSHTVKLVQVKHTQWSVNSKMKHIKE